MTIIDTEIIPYKLVTLVLISNAFSVGMLLSDVELNDYYKGFHTELRARSTHTSVKFNPFLIQENTRQYIADMTKRQYLKRKN